MATATGADSWEVYKDGTKVDGADGDGNEAGYVINNAMVGDSGMYTVRFTNTVGTTESSPAQAIVTAP